jgi:Na+/H+ antiporter NhaD/arsenite permease-like protein
MDVGILTVAFCTPVLIGFLLKPSLGETFSMFCLVAGVALFGIAFVYRKRVQSYLQEKYRTKAELIIEVVRTRRYFVD